MTINKTTHVQFGEAMDKKIDEMQEYYSLRSRAEMIRNAINGFYGLQYRKERFGYQAGTGSKKDTRISEMEKWDKLSKTGTDEEIIDFCREIGYFKLYEEKYDCDVVIEKKETGEKGMALHYHNNAPSLFYQTMTELKDDVLQFLTPRK
jgi:hypothetical protein